MKKKNDKITKQGNEKRIKRQNEKRIKDTTKNMNIKLKPFDLHFEMINIDNFLLHDAWKKILEGITKMKPKKEWKKHDSDKSRTICFSPRDVSEFFNELIY